MSKHNLPIIAVIQTLENETLLAEALFFPEVCRFNDKARKVRESLQANLRKLIEEMSLGELYQRHPVGDPEIGEVEITLDPPAKSVTWSRPVALKFPIVRWSQGGFAQIAYIPSLGIEVVATSPPTRAALDRLIPHHIRAALARSGALHSLGKLIWLQRCRELTIEPQSIEVTLPTSKQVALRSEEREESKKSALAEAGADLTREKLSEGYEIDEIVAQLAEILTGRSPRSILLVGRSGVGKTTLVHELVRRRADFQLGHTPFWATNGSRLIAGMSGFGQWQARCQKLWHEAAQSRAILYLGNLIELIEVGKSSNNSLGIASFFRPHIARGDALVIAECTPEQLSLIERTDPRLLSAFHQIRIEEPSLERGRNILLNVAMAFGAQNRQAKGQTVAEARIEIEGIERIDQLHRRYAAYSTYPGRPVRFLKNLLQNHLRSGGPGGTLTAEDVTAAFSRETGLPRVLLDERAELDLEATRSWFSSRVIGQPDAVDLIVNLLAMVKAGLTRPRKPIASLLFVGPTGVGKTEMAKSLTEFLFQDRQRLVRFDMSEYANQVAVDRLIGGAFGSEGLLTSKVREQPFAVILLDEFEKAHPSLFDLLLQVLGEGRLTDAMGRVADFSNAVVIMTSNLGAESFQRSQRGQRRLTGFEQGAATRQAASRHFTSAARQALRPEMFNRIDRIVSFAPLDEETVLRIAEREIDRIKRRDGIYYRGVSLKVWDGVAEYLAHRGYDVRYGARPLKRVIENQILVPLAEELNRYPQDVPLTLDLRVEQGGLKFDIQPSPETRGKTAHPDLADQTLPRLPQLIDQCMEIRREAQNLESSPAALNLRNEIFTKERAERRLAGHRWKNPADLEHISDLPRLRNGLKAINDFSAKIKQFEHRALLTIYGKAGEIDAGFDSSLLSVKREWNDLLISTYSLRFERPDSITLAIFSQDSSFLFALAGTYYRLSRREGARIEASQFIVKQHERARKTGAASTIERGKIDAIEKFLASPREGVIGIALGIDAPFAYPKFETERGLHQLVRQKKLLKCLVQTGEQATVDYQPPDGIERPDAIGHQEKRRSYQIDQSLIDDHLLRKKVPWSGRGIDETIGELIEESLIRQARALIEK